MPLEPNSRLGPYEIKSTLGVGGMGEVYRARDTRLDRDVALKVLREDFGSTFELRARFEREARAVATLSHPNIVAVYDFGVDDGRQYIAHEFVDGESLRQAINGKPLPVRKLIDIAVQIADGLAAAHAAGIVHRDLKPENVLLTQDGRAKIVDFGLARQSARSAAGSDNETASAAVQHLTSAGTVVGTAGYMSPEQIVRKEVTYRSDQFSFGLILHEMATGRQAFARSSSVETMAAIVRDEPPPIEQKLPPPLQWTIDRCLAKEPAQRYESTGDLYRELRGLRDHLSEAYSSSGALPAMPVTPAREVRWLPVALGIGGLLLGALLVWFLQPATQDISRYRYTHLATGAARARWSPNGKAIAYDSAVDGTFQVFTRQLNSPGGVQITHEQRDSWATGWSSDGARIFFVEATGRQEPPFGGLYSVANVGGEPERVMDLDCTACALSPDGKVFASLQRDKDQVWKLFISDPIGSPPREYSPAPFNSRDLYNQPQMAFSPDGKQILLSMTGVKDKDSIWLVPYPAGSATPHPVFQGLRSFSGITQFSWMPDARHVVVSYQAQLGTPQNLWMGEIGSDKLVALTADISNQMRPAVSPDGKRLVYQVSNTSYDVVSLSLTNGQASPLMVTGRQEMMPAWTADQLTWVTDRAGPWQVWVRNADGSERPAVTSADFPSSTKWFMNPAISPDGQRIIYARIAQAGETQLWISSLSGGTPVRLTKVDGGSEYGGSWSPDGSRFAYLESGNGRSTLAVIKTSGSSTPTVTRNVLVNDNFLPDWSPTGDWITMRDKLGWYLLSPDGKTEKFLGDLDTQYLAFSRDGKLLYGITDGTAQGQPARVKLFSLDPVTLKQVTIKELGGPEVRPRSQLIPGIRFSLTPDGKGLVYSTGRERIDLWMLEGYRQPGWRGRLASLFGQ